VSLQEPLALSRNAAAAQITSRLFPPEIASSLRHRWRIKISVAFQASTGLEGVMPKQREIMARKQVAAAAAAEWAQVITTTEFQFQSRSSCI
jgi:hypothetical protein